MDRVTVYAGQIPLETDLLRTNKFAMMGIAKLAAAMLGTATVVNGLACVPTAPAGLTVNVNPGEIYSLMNVDSTAYSSVAADTTHQILKQGILMDAANLSCPAPGTSGQSINYLIQATYQDSDTDLTALPYYNASNTTQAWSGPNNSGTAQATTRKGIVVLSAKAGVSATTGSQTTPAADSGYTGLWVVTVANGQTQITAGNITKQPGAPFFPGFARLDGSTPFTGLQQGITAGLSDNSTNLATTAWVSMLGVAFPPAAGISFATNTTLTVPQMGGWGDIQASGLTVTLPLATSCRIGSTFTLRGNAYGGTLKGNGTDAIVSATGASANTLSLLPNEIATVECNGTTWFVTMGGVGPMTTGRLLNVQIFTASGTYTPTAGTKSVLVEGCGAGGAGGGVPIASGTVAAVGGGGSAGSFGKKRILSGFSGVAVTIGAAGAGAANAAGTAGGTSSFGSLVTFPGGGGGAVGTVTSTASVNAVGGTQSNAPTSADIASPGWTGKPGINLGGASAFSGSGGDSPYGVAGGYAGANATYVQNGTAALGFGAGGGGAIGSNSGTTAAGGNGAPGLIIVWEYA
ncbi:protein of unknown function [Ralstonia solanacearum CMR15]|nr:protein of unknown function [Ralstonia solanacearum CMR15]